MRHGGIWQGSIALLAVFTTAAALGGCGGSSSDSTATESRPSATRSVSSAERARYDRQAEAICQRSTREARAIGDALAESVTGASSPQAGITTGLIEPGVRVISREAARLRDLGPAPPSPQLEIYLGLFDPIVDLARQRAEAGTAGDVDSSHRLELLVGELADEQSAAASQYGLSACSISFAQAAGISE